MAVVVVTGASSGIGAATARLYGARRDTVVLVARRADRLQAVAQDVSRAGGNAVVEALDAADGDAVVAMASRVVAAHGAPDVVVNSAGAGRWLNVEDTSPEELAQLMDAPFRAAFHACHAFLPAMLRRRSGVFVHVNSPACVMPWPGSAGYAAARWALRGLHEALVQDLHGTGVSSSHLIVGEVSSEYFTANPGTHERLPAISRMIPVSRPETCARLIARMADRRQRERIYPWILSAFYVQARFTPGLVRFLSRWPGRRPLRSL